MEKMNKLLPIAMKTLNQAGYRLTGQRQIILEILFQNSKQYLDCEAIYDRVKRKNHHLGIATIYRTLSLLEKLHLISAISPNDERKRYRLQIGGVKKCLLICRKCGFVEEYLQATEWIDQIQERNAFSVEEVGVYGTCKGCYLP